MLQEELKLVLRTRRFWGAMALMLLCLSGYAGIDWYECRFMESRPSSLYEVVSSIFFGGVMLMLPLCAALPAGILQVEEVQSGVIDLRVMNLSIRRYTAYKFLSAFLGGAIAMGLAFALHAIAWNIIATPCDITKDDYWAIPFAQNCIYYPWQAIFYSLPIYLWMMLGIAFCGGVWAVMSITAAMYIHDKLLVIAVPFCVYYLWHCGLPRAVLGIKTMPHPADLYNDGLTLDVVYKSIAIYLCILILCGIFYVLGLKRRYSSNE